MKNGRRGLEECLDYLELIMSNVAIPVAGAIIGGWIGGPTGASVGWAAGSYYQASQQDPEPAKIQDLRLQTSTYGVSIPIIFGKQRIAGNIIWSTDKVAHTVTSGGKGGGPETTSVTYTVSMAIALCEGDIKGIGRVWEDGKLKSNGTAKLPGGTLYLGTDGQSPDSTIEASEGIGNVPAYRGITYIVLEDFDLGLSGRVPNFSFETFKE